MTQFHNPDFKFKHHQFVLAWLNGYTIRWRRNESEVWEVWEAYGSNNLPCFYPNYEYDFYHPEYQDVLEAFKNNESIQYSNGNEWIDVSKTIDYYTLFIMMANRGWKWRLKYAPVTHAYTVTPAGYLMLTNADDPDAAIKVTIIGQDITEVERPCQSPYCECDVGCCKNPGFFRNK